MMSRPVIRVLLAVASTCLAIGCTEAACTLVGGESGVWVDTAELGLPIEAGGEVCLDARCVPLGWSEHLGGQNGLTFTSFKVDDEMADELALVVRDAGGEVVAGPSEVVLNDTYPNGKSCPPKLRTATIAVTAGGEVEARSS